MMEKRWVYKEIPDEKLVEELATSIRINPSLASILLQRGISDYSKSKSFFRPEIEELHDPFLMKDMDKAVSRLSKAIDNQEKILIYGDYDVDGTTSVALVYGFLKTYTQEIDFYIPDRYTEGYGVSRKGIEFAREQGFSLIISLDCGVKALDMIALAASYGIDFIVCDHHNPDELPEAHAILDPKRSDCPYPYKELSGCGVGFKFMQALCAEKSLSTDELFQRLDLVAVSIASDIVQITGENRVLAYFGIKILNESPRPGLKALLNSAGLKKDLDIQNIVFGIGPRINAAGRIAHAKTSVELLLAENLDKAEKIAALVNDNNSLRKDYDQSITEQALTMIQQERSGSSPKTTVLFRPDWHKGVIGIVASRCIEKYHRPTIILTESNNFATGSARSIPGFDLYEAITKCSDLLEQYGGHTHAAGLTLKVENIEAFRKRFEEVAAEVLHDDDLLPIIELDCKISLNRITTGFYNILRQMGPFGPGNMQPVFYTEDVCIAEPARLLKEKHIKLWLTDYSGAVVEAIGFNMSHFYERIMRQECFDVCYSIAENTFNGNTNLQLFIKDIKFRNDR